MKQKVAILYGGPSSEHEVSIKSAQNVLANIDKEKFDVIEIFISKGGLCSFESNELKVEEVIKELKTKCDIVFPVLHGTFGEDGTLQKLLEKENIPFVGSGSIASKKAIDKNISNEIFLKNQLLIPRSQIISIEDLNISINFPIIIKPISEGSSVGLFKFNSIEEYKKDIKDILKKYSKMLVQEFITGREFTCGVIKDNSKNISLPVSEVILQSNKIFDYEAKYTAGVCLEITPAEIDVEIANRIQEISLRCHEIIGCKSISRTDVIVDSEMKVYVLETNTLPGMTKISFIPAQADVYGLSMKNLITILLESI